MDSKKQSDIEQNTHIDIEIKPWLKQPEWQCSSISSNAKNEMSSAWWLAFFVNALASPILFVLADKLKQGEYQILAGLFFNFLGFVLIIKAWKMTREWRCYGDLKLELNPFPPRIGESMNGSFIIKESHNTEVVYKVELLCGVHRGNHWEKIITTQTESIAEGTQVKFHFEIPKHLPASYNVGAYPFWRIRIFTDTLAINLNRIYYLPVSKVENT